jgi:hypothetical protein
MSTLSGGPNIVFDGLVLYLDASNTKSYIPGTTVWNDISRVGNNGTLVNGPTFDSGNVGSIVFDGVDDYVIHNSLNLGTICTWSVWLNYVRASISNEAFVILGANQPDRYTLFYYFQNKTFYINYGGTFSGFTYNPGLNISTWYNITNVREGNVTTIYLNGISIGTITIVSNASSIFSIIGAERTTIYYSAVRVATVNYYNRALTASEILQNYNATKSRFNLS